MLPFKKSKSLDVPTPKSEKFKLNKEEMKQENA